VILVKDPILAVPKRWISLIQSFQVFGYQNLNKTMKIMMQTLVNLKRPWLKSKINQTWGLARLILGIKTARGKIPRLDAK
jgi:hypothetical protein